MRRVVVALAISLASGCTSEPVGVAPRVTASRLRAIVPGMTATELRALLGPPLSTRPWGENASLLFYAREVPLAHHSPTLWVLVRAGLVEEAQAECSDLWRLDEHGLFVVRSDLRWESPEFAGAFPEV
jgi:hypothetical protein